MLLDLKLHVPHGGIFVLFIPGITNSLPLYLLTVVIGTAVTAGMLYLLKRPIAAEATDVVEEPSTVTAVA